MPDPNPGSLPDHDHEPDTRPVPPPSLPEMPDTQVTRQQQPADRTRVLQPGKPSYQVLDKPKRGHPRSNPYPGHSRRENPMAVPLWSVALMLMAVAAVVVVIIGVIVILGGTPALEKPPRVMILTAVLTPDEAGDNFSVLASATIPAQYNSSPAAPLALQGPTLAPVAITPTLESIGIGKNVLVTAEGAGLNIRSLPGTIDTAILFVAPPGQSFVIADGPLQADGLTWWKVQNPIDATQSGWAAAAFLEVVPGS